MNLFLRAPGDGPFCPGLFYQSGPTEEDRILSAEEYPVGIPFAFPTENMRAKSMNRPTGVLLDVDGTLVDSNDAHAHAWVAALAEAGVHAEYATVRSLIGKGGDKLLPEVSGIDPESSRGKAISARRGEIFQSEYLPRLKPTPGARNCSLE